MRVLVVHDRADIAAEIVGIIEKVVPRATVELEEDGVGARQKLASTIYDLLIIDLTLPHIKGGQPDYRIADELLKELFTLGSLNIPGDVIGLTRDIEALSLVNTSLGPHVMIAIQESGDGSWRKYLEDKIAYASRAAVTRQVSVNRHFLYDAMIITALEQEFEPFKSKFDFVPIRHFPGALEFPFSDKNGLLRKGVGFSIGKSGGESRIRHAISSYVF
jgi:CheY-like chemotaxis protein